MQVRHERNVSPSCEGPNKVVAVCWSPNSLRLALATADRVVSLFDENGVQRNVSPKDSFNTKPADPARKMYFLTGLAWSPDSTRLAVAQSDNILFVYKVRGAGAAARSPPPSPPLPKPLPPPPLPLFPPAGPRLGG
jgi:intraflagellar transport protein 172